MTEVTGNSSSDIVNLLYRTRDEDVVLLCMNVLRDCHVYDVVALRISVYCQFYTNDLLLLLTLTCAN